MMIGFFTALKLRQVVLQNLAFRHLSVSSFTVPGVTFTTALSFC